MVTLILNMEIQIMYEDKTTGKVNGEPQSSILEKDRLLTSRETARKLGICERSLWGITSPRGSLPAVRIGRTVRYSPADIEAFIEASKGGVK